MWEQRLGRAVDPLPDPRDLLLPLRDLVADADVVVVNMEAAIGERRVPGKCGPRSRNCYAMRSPNASAAALREIAGDTSVAVVANIANNHSGDAGPSGRAETIERLEAAGVYVTGADTIATEVVTSRGDTVAVLGFSTSPGTPDVRDLAAVRRHVERAARKYSRVIVTMHLGGEGSGAQRTRDVEERLGSERRGNPVQFATTASRAGANLIAGHGPHVMRAIEWRNGALVAYSLGNLVTDGPFSFRSPNDRAGILCATLARDGTVTEAQLRATVQSPPGLVAADPGRRAITLVDSLGRLDFPGSRASLDSLGRIQVPVRSPRVPVAKDSVPR
jgi:poly-gamma-glutamate capsule biosynthesis protein CapA/YwtB (metallophosphatase superfamily)